jgi:hypothetical protein
MTSRLKNLLSFLLAGLLAPLAFAQTQPTNSVAITQIAVAGGGTFGFPTQNESYGAVGSTINITAQATGTFPASGYVYEFFVNGISVGVETPNPANGTPGTGAWTPTQPGAYFITVKATGIGAPVTSLPVRYFAVGTQIIGPQANTIVPIGSSVVIQATAQPTPLTLTGTNAFVQKVDFYADGVLVGSDTTYPFSFIYKPAGTPTAHTIEARAYDNENNQISPNGTATEVLNMATPIGTAPTSVISAPIDNSVIPIGNSVNVSVDAISSTGFITKVELYVDGVLLDTKTAFPYTFTWSPTVTGLYRLIALTYDDKQNVIASNGGVPTSVTVSLPPTVTIISPTNGSTVAGGTAQLKASATDSNVDSQGQPVTITSVQFFVNGTFVGQATQPDAGTVYSVTTTLEQKLDPVTGVPVPSLITALATDSAGGTGLSAASSVTVTNGGTNGGGTVIGQAPTVTVTAPATNTSVPVNNPVSLSANATDPDGNIVSVQFFANTQSVATVTTYPYVATWTPTSLGTFAITARAVDNSGNSVRSISAIVTVTGNNAPTVAITSPASGANLVAGSPVTLAATAADTDGTVASVRFTANGVVVGTASSAPFRVTWTPSGSGTYVLVAQATDNSGNFTASSPITITVGSNGAPAVSIISPAIGSGVQVGAGVTISASASDPDGVIKSVEFFANGISVGSKTSPPYTISWTPAAEGVYHLVAVATDNANLTTTSSDVGVLAFTSTGASSANVFTGTYLNGFEAGKFALMSFSGKTVTFIGHSTSGTTGGAKTYYYADIPMDAAGGFSQTIGGVTISGTVTNGSVTGTISNGTAFPLSFIGVSPVTIGTAFAASGYYSGNLSGRPASTLAAIVGTDGSIMAYLKDGSFSDMGDSKVDATGTFTITTVAGNTLTGRADPATGFLTGKLSGTAAADFTGGLASGGSFSDGALRNLSTRGQVGTGGNVLITGFVVGGSTPKQVLIRAIGPALTPLGVSGAIADPQLQVFNGAGAAIPGASNDNWNAADAAAMNAVGAFALPVGSKDAALIITLAPGLYTTQVSGVGGSTGIALIEFYDLDSPSPFSSQKVVNVSTRGQVGKDDAALIAGFVISGNAPKKVLLRAVGGPTLATLAALPVSAVLSDPVLTLRRRQSDGSVIVVRENDDWESGNDAALISAAADKSGAFPVPSGSKDAMMLISLPPGTYTALVSGNGGGTGVAIVEVYEVP